MWKIHTDMLCSSMTIGTTLTLNSRISNQVKLTGLHKGDNPRCRLHVCIEVEFCDGMRMNDLIPLIYTEMPCSKCSYSMRNSNVEV